MAEVKLAGEEDVMQKTYLVFGAAGSIGGGVVRHLLAAGHQVIASVREHHQEETKELMASGAIVHDTNDVADERQLYGLRLLFFATALDGIVCAVGHCPPNGFPEAIKYPLSQLPLGKYQSEINMHQVGVLNIFQCMLPTLVDGGCFLFISSAITRLKGQFPLFLQAHYHASVISAEDWLIDGMRHDPEVTKRNVKIHRIAPAAVDTSFHQAGPKPPKLIPIADVAQEVIQALQSDTHVDKQLL